ncbi:MAG: hypothetical protein CMA63_08025 [Euryarchaeota archaeon]|nr:hypothetical protein [Euryarchaeota archaeon]|tara:strand:+ start:6135 stop:6707 length:573 start_codon:yes stop_codon:yes gene_type:complete
MVESSLVSPDSFAAFAVSILGLIVVWDAFWLTRQRQDIPRLGELKGGGFAWKSEGPQEVIRQWGNLASMAAMMALPWALIGASDTSPLYAVVWDVLLALHLISLLVPKRFAVTRTHLFADGQRYDWKRLRLQRRQPARRIMLLRKGWGVFGPLPLGGAHNDLTVARQRIAMALDGTVEWNSTDASLTEQE